MKHPGSWNRIPAVRHARVLRITDRFASLPSVRQESDRLLAYGNGRSYGGRLSEQQRNLAVDTGARPLYPFRPHTWGDSV